MPVRLLTPQEFNEELLRRGCTETTLHHEFGRIWRRPNGRAFTVPHPDPASGRYPDWMLRDLIENLRLPDPSPNH